MKKPLGTIEEEKAACIAAFRRYPRSKYVWCCHHETLFEMSKGWMKRIRYIYKDKYSLEQASRFRSFRPVKLKSVTAQLNRRNKCRAFRDNWYGENQRLQNVLAKLTRQLFNREWPDNTWTGRKVRGT